MKPFYTSARKWGNSILHRYVDSDGVDHKAEVEYRPTLFMVDNARTEGDWRAMDTGRVVSPLQTQGLKDAAESVETYSNMGVLYGQQDPQLNFLAHTYKGDIVFERTAIRVFTLDIEVYSKDGFPSPIQAAFPINAFAIRNDYQGKVDCVVFTTLQIAEEVVDDYRVIQCSSERDLLTRVLAYWVTHMPHAVTGWNTSGFDLPFIYTRIASQLGDESAKRLSPHGIVRRSEYVDNFGNNAVEVDIYGVADLDLRDLYKKFIVKAQESYSLNYISHVELKEKKLDYSDAGSLHTLAETDPLKFIRYNVRDVDLVHRIDDKRRLVDLAFYLAYASKVNFRDVFSPIKTWDSLVYNYLLGEKQVPPIKSPGSKSGAYEGAYVKSPQLGLSHDVVSFDVASLYPSIIRQWNMCPSTIVESASLPYQRYVDEMLERQEWLALHATDNNVALAANGVAFSREKKGVFPILVERLYNDRKVARKVSKEHMQAAELLKSAGDNAGYEREKAASSAENTRQGAIKVLLNSLYGATGSRFFRYYDLRIAEGITLCGQVAIRWVERDVNRYLGETLKLGVKDRCLAIDTDSTYFTLVDLTHKFLGESPTIEKRIDFLDKACDRIEKDAISPSFKALLTYANCPELAIEMKREAIATKAFWVAKKCYALDVYDMEGVRYAEPELKVMGLQLVKSSTPKFCRDKLEESVKILLRESDPERIIKFVDKTWSDYQNIALEDIATTTSVSDIEKWIGPDGKARSGTPMNSRGAMVYNERIDKLGISNQYDRIRPGDKVKMLKLRQPNSLRSHIVAFPVFLPKEFQIEGSIDRRSMFDGSFLESLRVMCHAIGVDVEPSNSIEDFFK